MELEELQKHWDEFGKTDPLWAILTWPEKKERGWELRDFFRCGEEEISTRLDYITKLTGPTRKGTALDFGCGVGRLTQALGDYFERCWGVDISPSMIEQANKFNRHGERCTYVLNETSDLSVFADNQFDLVYSVIVLQHMEPRYSLNYLREFVRVLKPGGVTFFQLPSGLSLDRDADKPTPPITAFSAEVTPVSIPPGFFAGQPTVVRVQVRNTSEVQWPSRGKMRVRLGNHWINEDGTRLVWDDGRQELPRDLGPGENAELEIRVVPPANSSRAVLEIDVLQEYVAWFGDQGSTTLRRVVDIFPELPPETQHSKEAAEDFTPVMELYSVPVEQVKETLEQAGAKVIAVEEDDSAGPHWVSYHYVAVKR